MWLCNPALGQWPQSQEDKLGLSQWTEPNMGSAREQGAPTQAQSLQEGIALGTGQVKRRGVNGTVSLAAEVVTRGHCGTGDAGKGQQEPQTLQDLAALASVQVWI